MARPIVRKYVNTICAYCKRQLNRAEGKSKSHKNKRHFCSQTCYWSWLKYERPASEIQHKYTDDDLLKEIQRVADLLGYVPTMAEMLEHSKIYPSIFQKRFRGWDKAISLINDPAPKFNKWNIDDVSPEDGAWLAGIIDGEGCFRIQSPSPKNISHLSRSYAPVFTMTLRDDDKRCLQEVQRIIGFTNSFHIDKRNTLSSHPNDRPAYKINLRDTPILAHRLIPILEKYPLRSKKVRDFVLFKMAVSIFYKKREEGGKNIKYTDFERQTLDKLYHALQDIKKYQSSLQDILLKYNL